MARDDRLNLQSLSPDVVDAARAAAAVSGLTLEEWLNRTILGTVGGYTALRNGRRTDSADAQGRRPDAFSTISQNLSVAADAASAAGLSLEEWLSRAILHNTTAIARQGRASEEPDLTLFRARAIAPAPAPFPASQAPSPQASSPQASSPQAPAPQPRKDATMPAPRPPEIAPVATIQPLATPSPAATQTAASREDGNETAPPAPAPAAPSKPLPEKPAAPNAAARTDARPPAIDPPAAPAAPAQTRAAMPDTSRSEPPAPAPDPELTPEPDPDPGNDALLDKRLAQIIADAREEVAAMARNSASATPPPKEALPAAPVVIGAKAERRKSRSGPWLTVGALLVLAVVAAAVWVLPKLPELGVRIDKKPDFAQQLPDPDAASRPGGPASVDRIETLPLPRSENERAESGSGAGLPEPASQHVADYQKAAAAGNVKAQIALAQLHLRGEGVAKDATEAARWYREAASKGNDANAQYALGVLLERGIGVEKDPIGALLWFQRAAQQGHPAAITNTGVAFSRGDVVPRDYAKAASYFQRAADAGVPQAQFNLGLLYENGLGVSKDVLLAYRWYSAASAGGDPGATDALKRLSASMSAEDLERAKDLVRQSAGKT